MDCCNVGCSNVVQVQDLETTTWSRVDCWRDWISWSSPLPSSAPPIIAPTSTLVRPPYMLFYWPPYILFYWPPCMYVCIHPFFIGHHTYFFIATIHAALPFYLPVPVCLFHTPSLLVSLILAFWLPYIFWLPYELFHLADDVLVFKLPLLHCNIGLLWLN